MGACESWFFSSRRFSAYYRSRAGATVTLGYLPGYYRIDGVARDGNDVGAAEIFKSEWPDARGDRGLHGNGDDQLPSVADASIRAAGPHSLPNRLAVNHLVVRRVGKRPARSLVAQATLAGCRNRQRHHAENHQKVASAPHGSGVPCMKETKGP